MQVGRTTIPDKAPDPAADATARATGPDFNRLIAQAQQEADRRAKATATTGATNAKFSDQAWLAAVKAHGPELGLAQQASAITKDRKGELVVADPGLRSRILNLRNDPLLVSIMAGKRAGESRAALTAALGRVPSDAEVRVSDAVGAKEAGKLLKGRDATPYQSAAILAPDAAKANPGLFLRPDGSQHTVDEVLGVLMKPRDMAATAETERLASGHMTFASESDTAASQRIAAALRAQATADATAKPFARTTVQPTFAPTDLNLTNATLGQVSIPGSTKGTTAPTGAKVTGWRGQLTSEVTQHISQPGTNVRNAPSNVTVPADAVTPRLPPQVVAMATDPKPLQLSPTAVAPVVAAPVATVPRVAIAIAPVQPTVMAALEPQPAAITAEEAAVATVLRPSRYGPGILTTMPAVDSGTLDATAAGIRPSRIMVAAAITAQQQATAIPRVPKPVAPIVFETNPLLPPVPRPVGLPPVTSREAMLAQPAPNNPVVDANLPLDLSPNARVVPPLGTVTQAAPLQTFPRQRPKSIPGRF